MTNEKTERASEAGAPPRSVRYNYIKSGHFRVIHVDGAYGGLTGHGFIHAAVYSERPTIPQVTEAEFVEGGTLTEHPVEKKDGMVREVEADLVMSLETAKALREWLDDKIGQLEEAFEAIKPR